MKIICFLLSELILAAQMFGCSYHQVKKDVLYQTSTINALLEAVYDGETMCDELNRHGDFGIGTFNSLDGEMICLEGKFYQIKADGNVYLANKLLKTPFAAVTFFESDKSLFLEKVMNYEQLKNYLDDGLPTKNIFYAVKIEGDFNFIKTRSVPKQTKPYTRLVDVVGNQPIFEFKNVKGTIVGFRCPNYAEGINVPGYHFHFITADKKAGGHLLECELKKVKIEIDNTAEFYMILPQNSEFYNLDFIKKDKNELEKVEK